MPGAKSVTGVAIALVWANIAFAQAQHGTQQEDAGFLSSLLSRIEAKAATVYLGGMSGAPVPTPVPQPSVPPPSAAPVEVRPAPLPVVEFLSAGSSQSPRAVVRMPDGARVVVVPAAVMPDGRRVVSITYDGGVVVEDQGRRRTLLPYAMAPRAPHPTFPTTEGR